MSELYDRVYKQIAKFREDGHEPDKVIVPAENWREVKDNAEVLDGEGFMSGDKTLVNGVRATYLDPLGDVRVVFEVPTGDD